MYQGNFGFGPKPIVSFVQKQNSTGFNSSVNSKIKQAYLNIIEQNLDFLPRLFTITTNKRSYKFNTDILKDASQTISKYLNSNPNSMEYHLDFNDEENVMKKIEDMFRGVCVSFEFNELVSIRKVINLLSIASCPDYMKPDLYSPLFYSIPAKMDVQIEKSSLSLFLKTQIQKTFTIKTNKKEYKCTDLGIYSSKIIRDQKIQDPNLNEYVYIFDDEDDEFQFICDLFNFENVSLTINNMDSLKKIAEDLQIDSILGQINEFIDSYENSVQLIDDKKVIIDTIDEIFYLLHNINNLTVDSVKKSIINSIWIKTDENILELAACILQVVRVSYKLQPFLIELITSLDENKGEIDPLKNLLPFIVKQMKFNFFRSPFYCSFIFKMSQKGIVTMKEITTIIQKSSMCSMIDGIGFTHLNLGSQDFVNVLLWFIPELLEINKDNEDFFEHKIDHKTAKFLKIYFPNNIEGYKKMRDSGEPIDEIARAIFYDDVDTLQSIISKRSIDINENKLSPSLFDVFNFDENKSYINYSAENGSTKCFKYLLLNHAELDDLTFGYAVYGGNTEIIRTVDQNYRYTTNLINRINNDKNFSYNQNANYSYINGNPNYYCNYDKSYLLNMISPAIMNHNNDLFDWIFENKYLIKEAKNEFLMKIAFISIQNGNAHSFIECIDKGLDLNSSIRNFLESIINLACHNGFYRILQLILSLSGSNIKNISTSFEQALFFGNILIYKMIYEIKPMVQNNSFFLEMAIEREYVDIVTYIIDNNNFIPLGTNSFVNMFCMAIQKKNSYLFNFLLKKYDFEKLICNYDLSLNDIISILNSSCSSGFFEAVKLTTEFILKNFPSADFTIPFSNSIGVNNNEICQYFIDKNVYISVNQRLLSFYKFAKADCQIIKQMLEKNSPNARQVFIKSVFNPAISFGNKNLVKYLLDKKNINMSSLFSAVRSHDIEIVNMILSLNSKPSFINQVSSIGTALNVAVSNNDIEIVKRLLSLPGIDPSLYDNDSTTPLMSAICNFNIEMINLIIDFYGDEIQSQIWQLNDAVKRILRNLSDIDEDYKSKNNEDDDDDDDNDDDNNNEDEDGEGNERLMFIKPNFITNNKKKMFEVISLLTKFENIDLNCHLYKYTLLSYACEVNEIDLVRLLLKSKKVNVNSYAPLTGNTPLMIAIENNNLEIVQLLIEYPLININQRNFQRQSALTFAVNKELDSIINLIVNNNKFDIEESCLDHAFFIANEKISKLLLNVKGLDVNFNIEMFDYRHIIRKNPNDEILSNLSSIPYVTPLIKAIIEKQFDMIDLIISHPSFDPEQSHVINAIFTSLNLNDIGLFRKLLKLVNNDVNLLSSERNSLLCYSISIRRDELTTEILNNPSFDPAKSKILQSFMIAACYFNSNNNLYGMNYFGNPNTQAQINKMNELCDYDENHGHLIDFKKLLPSGKSFFTALILNIENINEVVDFLLEHGVDPNFPDKKNIYPIQYAILSNSIFLTRKLINLKEINLLVKTSGNYKNTSKNETILHLLARSDMNEIFREILDKNLFDINQTDDDGETPLMKACRSKKVNNVILLFTRKELDYHLKNNKGNDALEISKQSVYRENNALCMQFNNQRAQLNRIDVNDVQPDEKRNYLKDIISSCQNKYVHNYYH